VLAALYTYDYAFVDKKFFRSLQQGNILVACVLLETGLCCNNLVLKICCKLSRNKLSELRFRDSAMFRSCRYPCSSN